MTTLNKASLKTFFQTNDVPTGTDYGNFIDSCVNLAETASQSMLGPLNPTELVTPRVSATNGNFTGIVSAASIYSNTVIYASAAQFIGTVSAANFTAPTGRVTASAGTFTAAVSANSLHVDTIISATGDINSRANLIAGARTVVVSGDSGIVNATGLNVTADVSAQTGTVYASAVRSTNGVIAGSGIVSAAGTTQAAAAVLVNVINRGKGIADGVTTGFTPLANRAGLVQYLFNEGVSANLWPPTGGFINGLAVNTAFPLVASAAYTIFHITASSYGVK